MTFPAAFSRSAIRAAIPFLPALTLVALLLAAPAHAQTEGLPLVKPAGKEPALMLGGLLQTQAEVGDAGDARFGSNRSRIYLRRARVNLVARYLEDYDFRLEMDLAGSLAETSGLRAQLTDAYITWTRHPQFTIRGGQFKTPYGYEQLVPDPITRTIERSLPNDRLTLGRQMGVMVQGDLLEKRFGYSIGAFNGTGVNNDLNDNKDFVYAGRLSSTPWQTPDGKKRLSVGANGYISHDTAVPGMAPEFGFDSTPGGAADNIFRGNRRGWGVDVQLKLDRLEIWGEYLGAHFEPRNPVPAARFDAVGFYAQGTVMLVPARLQGVLKFESFRPRTGGRHFHADNIVVGFNNLIKGDDIKLAVNWMRTTLDGDGTADAIVLPTHDNKLLVRMQVAY